MAGGAGARAAAFGLDALDKVLLGRLHDGHAVLGVDDLLGAVRLDEGNLWHQSGGSWAYALGRSGVNGGAVVIRPRSVSGLAAQIQAYALARGSGGGEKLGDESARFLGGQGHGGHGPLTMPLG